MRAAAATVGGGRKGGDLSLGRRGGDPGVLLCQHRAPGVVVEGRDRDLGRPLTETQAKRS